MPATKTFLSASAMALAFALVTPAAFADETAVVDQTTATTSHIALEIGAGIAEPLRLDNAETSRFAPPLGLGSIAIDLAPSKYLAFNLGLGLGLSGPSAGASVRLRMPGGPHWAFAPAVGLAWSHRAEESYTTSSYSWTNIVSLPVELGFERKTGWGRVRFYAGYKKTLRSDAPSCDARNFACDSSAPSPLYLGLSLGYDLR